MLTLRSAPLTSSPLIMLLFNLLLVPTLAVGQSGLPPCPNSWRWDNCQGTQTFPDGNKYAGEFKDGKFNGHGTFTFGGGSKNAGDKYIGEFQEGDFNGRGTYTYADGSMYVGEFKAGNCSGQGTFTFGRGSKYAGDKYVGEFRDCKRSGHGTYTYADGSKYVGEFQDDKPNGQGTRTYADGRKSVGLWKDDAFVKTLTEAEVADQEVISMEKVAAYMPFLCVSTIS